MADSPLTPMSDVGTHEQVPTNGNKRVLRTLRKRPFNLDKQQVVSDIIQEKQSIIISRKARMASRLERYAKLYGWKPEYINLQGEFAPTIWLPIMLASTLRLKAALENSIKSTRPIMKAKAKQRRNMNKESTIDNLHDYQFFMEIDGERFIDDYVSGFVEDGKVISHQRWVKKDETIVTVKVLPKLFEDRHLADVSSTELMTALLISLKTLFPKLSSAEMLDNKGYHWNVEYIELDGSNNSADIQYYEREDDLIEAHITVEMTTYDGPMVEVHDPEDILVSPVRAANLQPPGPNNPHGASTVMRICKTSINDIKRKREQNVFDLITDEDMKRIEDHAPPLPQIDQNDDIKRQKDLQAGITVTPATTRKNTERFYLEVYKQMDLNGDGFDEEIILWVEEYSQVLMAVRYLTEVYPGIPVKRPFSEPSFFPIANRFEAMGLAELLEPIQDIMQRLMEHNLEWGEITNTPNFVYRPTSGMFPSVVRLKSGEGYPVDDPERDIKMLVWNKDMSWVATTYAMIQQLGDKLAMQTDANFGRVPQGKASAFRTFSTTQALLGQSDARIEQVLRRLFHGFVEIFTSFHRLNRHFLPKEKQFRVLGVPEQGADPYITLKAEEIDFDVDFEFKASILSVSKQALGQALQEVAALVVSPLALQLGIVKPEDVHRLFKDMISSKDIDPDRYTTRPSEEANLPKILAEEAISAIKAFEDPVGLPLEQPMEHFQKLMAYAKSDKIGELTPSQTEILSRYIKKVMELIKREQLQMMQAQAAQQMQQEQNQGQPGAPPQNPPNTAAAESFPTSSANEGVIQ